MAKVPPQLGDLLRAWDYPRGQWDPSAILFGVDPGELDPAVPCPEEFRPESWRAITDAEGNMICLAPLVGPEGQKDWPETLAKLLNAMTEVVEFP